MEKQPKVSVIIPVYNVEQYLSRCLDSVISQNFNDMEIICINDGSKDASLRILEEYAGKDSRIVIIDKKNAGVSAARNDGIAAAKGEYLAFLDGDDFWEADCLAKIYQEAEHNHSDSPHQTENEIRQVVYYLYGVVGGKSGHGSAKHHREGKHRHAVAAETRSDLARHGQLCGYFLLGVLLVKKFHR